MRIFIELGGNFPQCLAGIPWLQAFDNAGILQTATVGILPNACEHFAIAYGYFNSATVGISLLQVWAFWSIGSAAISFLQVRAFLLGFLRAFLGLLQA